MNNFNGIEFSNLKNDINEFREKIKVAVNNLLPIKKGSEKSSISRDGERTEFIFTDNTNKIHKLSLFITCDQDDPSNVQLTNTETRKRYNYGFLGSLKIISKNKFMRYVNNETPDTYFMFDYDPNITESFFEKDGFFKVISNIVRESDSQTKLNSIYDFIKYITLLEEEKISKKDVTLSKKDVTLGIGIIINDLDQEEVNMDSRDNEIEARDLKAYIKETIKTLYKELRKDIQKVSQEVKRCNNYTRRRSSSYSPRFSGNRRNSRRNSRRRSSDW